jgi:hypothetical protein
VEDQPDNSTVVSLTEGGFCQLAGIQVGSGLGNRNIDGLSSDKNSSDPKAQINLPQADRKLPAKPVPHVPSKTSLSAPKNGAGGRHALDGCSDSTKQLAIAHKS